MTGLELRRLREDLGVSARLLGREARYAPAYIQAVETGREPLSPKFVARFLGALQEILKRRARRFREAVAAALRGG